MKHILTERGNLLLHWNTFRMETLKWIFLLALWDPSAFTHNMQANATDTFEGQYNDIMVSGDDTTLQPRLSTDSHVTHRRDKLESDYYKLEETLLKDYKTHLLPVYSQRTMINMSVNIVFYALHEVDEEHQTVSHFTWLNLQWTDDFLTWSPDHFNGVDLIELPGNHIWTPNVVYSNSVTEPSNVVIRAVVLPGGQVTWGPVGIQETMCTMDITYYPFDVQRCGVWINMWTNREKHVNMTCEYAAKDGMFMENADWELTDLAMEYRPILFDGDRYGRCYVSFLLKRRRLFLCLTLILPNVLLAILSSYVFLLPADCGEKMSYSMSLMLAFAVNLSVLIGAMPRSSLNVSYLMIYLTCLSIVATLSVITTACMQKLYHKNEVVASKVKVFVLFLGKIFCSQDVPGSRTSRKVWESGHQPTEDQCQAAYAHPGMTSDKMVDVKEDLSQPASNVQTPYGRIADRGECVPASKENQHPVVLQWKDAVVVLDHVFFRSFLFVIIAMTSVFMVTLFVGQ